MLRWPLPDPASAPEKVRLHAFRAVREEIMSQLKGLFYGEPGEGE